MKNTMPAARYTVTAIFPWLPAADIRETDSPRAAARRARYVRQHGDGNSLSLPLSVMVWDRVACRRLTADEETAALALTD